MNHHQDCRDDISDVKWTIDDEQIQNPKENLYIGKCLAVYSVNQRLFLKLRHVTYKEYCIEFIWFICSPRKISNIYILHIIPNK